MKTVSYSLSMEKVKITGMILLESALSNMQFIMTALT
jgi:hypothetical protein